MKTINWKKLILNRANLIKYLSLASIILAVMFFTLTNSNFISPYNTQSILTSMSPLLVMACGVAFALFLGSIDLSIGSVASCACVMLILLLPNFGATAYVLVILFGIFAGLLNGFLHAKLKIPSFIATLCTQSIWQSAAYVLSGGKPLSLLPKSWSYVNWGGINIFMFPLIFLLALAFVLCCYVIQTRSIIGKTMTTMGANQRAARLAGLNIEKAKIMAFLISGLGAALGGIFFAVLLKSGIPTVGQPYTLMAIAAATLGGILQTGGKGNVIMAILGAGLIIVIQNGMQVIAVDNFWQQIIFGLLVLSAIYVNTDKSRKYLVVK